MPRSSPSRTRTSERGLPALPGWGPVVVIRDNIKHLISCAEEHHDLPCTLIRDQGGRGTASEDTDPSHQPTRGETLTRRASATHRQQAVRSWSEGSLRGKQCAGAADRGGCERQLAELRAFFMTPEPSCANCASYIHTQRVRRRRLRARHCACRPLPSERPARREKQCALVDGRGVRGSQDRHVRDVGVLRAGDCTVRGGALEDVLAPRRPGQHLGTIRSAAASAM